VVTGAPQCQTIEMTALAWHIAQLNVSRSEPYCAL
jgi:hypothetical protein